METLKISKENLSMYKPVSHEVLGSDELKSDRRKHLSEGMVLGNLFKGKTKIRFLSEVGLIVEVEASIWHVTDSHVQLKSGITIPVNSIISVNI